MENSVIKFSRIDHLCVRKILVEEMLKNSKEELKNRVMLMLGKSLDSDLEARLEGQTIFFEMWIEDINKEIAKLM